MQRSEIARVVREVLVEHSARAGDSIQDDLPLGDEGLGLDSIALAEVLLDCELRVGVDDSDLLAELDRTLTVETLVDLLASA